MDEDAAKTGSWASYLVEAYRPGIPVKTLRRGAERLRAAAEQMAREGKPVRYVRSTIVPHDESCLFLVEAASESLLREAYARARVQFERMSIALPVEEAASEGRTRK